MPPTGQKAQNFEMKAPQLANNKPPLGMMRPPLSNMSPNANNIMNGLSGKKPNQPYAKHQSPGRFG
eukprot:CAMPEP_0205808244 /NCGR_PEP_ID=MMETSP0205-20121125/12139_1 /ASSEMBLY_ACC=CAM_ASM_000278 /TAXON_ID=36767 /ORGANISM="Euplotes focardii, Strain TN1" /LENGTH=65 /DNA_ID=CAMNT_0053083611 /DNA_START=396 /DNA_END=590 /DNA_ORIENTATION=+